MTKRLKVLLLYPNLMMKHLLPPAIGILSASLKKSGFEVDLFDTTYYSMDTHNPDEKRKEYLQVRSYDLANYGIHVKKSSAIEDFKAKVNSFGPDIIGVSVVEDTMSVALKFINALGENRPKTIFGGIYISYLKEKAFEHKEIDMVCVGEGEEAFVELCQRLQRGARYDDVKNIYIRLGQSIITNKLRPLVGLDTLPVPDYSLFEKKRFFSPMQGKMRVMIPVDFDRGCPYSCNFCASPAYREWYKKQNGENYFRKKSAAKIIDEMRHFVKAYAPEYLYFNSDTFLAAEDSALEFLLKAIKDRIGLPFWCQTRVETITEEKVMLLKECGCDRITIGIEHGNEEFRRKVVGKGFTNAQLLNAAGIINSIGIPLSVNNIIGFPYETRALIFDTIELNRQIRSDSVSVFIFYPYTGTALHKICADNDLIDAAVNNASLLQNSVVRNKELTKESLNSLLRTFCLYVKFSKDRWDEIGAVERNEPGSEKIFKRLSEEYQKKFF